MPQSPCKGYLMTLIRNTMLGGLLAALAASAHAQNFPNRPLRMIMPFPAGTSVNDVLGRALAQRLSEPLGQQVIFDNRSGAAGTIGSEMVAKSPPDGYTLLLAATGPLTIAPFVYRKLGYDTLRDFAPVAMVAIVPYIIVAHPSVPAKNLKELIALAKSRPKQLLFASSGTGGTPHLCTELMMNQAGISMLHIPYKGGSPAMIDTIAGQTQLFCTSVTNAAPFIKQGKIRGIGVTTLKRSPVLPDLATLDEQGLKGFDVSQWMGVLAPAKTPPAVIQRLHQAVARVVNDPEYVKFVQQQGAEPTLMTPDEVTTLMRNDLDRWGKLVKAIGIADQ
ncbi:MAG: tripartite tricarboxylate transporter substrate binding protein [Betaproteobacteria bacterium]|nr:tripartite tricarboxylate transporter substrate binding protein [Betaproteobacteria bacterium]